MTMTRRTFADLPPGAAVYDSSGKQAGTVTAAGSRAVYLDLGYPRPTTLTPPASRAEVVRLGDRMIFANANRQRSDRR